MSKAKSNDPELEIKAKISGADEWKKWNKDKKKEKNSGSTEGGGSALYFIGFIGSLVYWMQAATGFGSVISGILKSLVWPAYIVYKLLESFYG
ncbi:hypothetical protein KDA00_02515 [Candidatus Saccharibacteria bacterium]|nr:hypothetical protein [Candidatus Saccharibacteria bacterium]